MAGPLAGVTVLDLSRIVAGPWATQLLADMGADVIKVERPGEGDDTRRMGPPWVREQETGRIVDAAYFAACNRGKRSVTIDFGRPEGRALVIDLASRADVLVENYKVGGLARFGLDYPTLHATRPRLVYCSITGFGQTGPYRDLPGYDYIAQGMGGLMSVTGEADGRPGAGPQKVGVPIADLLTGMYATVAIVSALRARDAGGIGQHIDVALLDSQVATLVNQGMGYLVGGDVPRRLGTAHPNIVPYQTFRAADGDMIVAVGNDGQFARFCEAIGEPALAADDRFRTQPLRNENRSVLLPMLERIFSGQGRAAWKAMFDAAGVPCGPINAIDQVFADPQVVARGMRLDLPHPAAGSVPSIANPIRFSETPVEYRRAPPMLGEHTDEVLVSVLGLAPHEVARLRGLGVVG